LKLGLISSAWLGTPITTARGIELTRQIGFDSIDIFADPLEIDAKERRHPAGHHHESSPGRCHRLLRSRHRGFQ
jgi:hypothetical protein